jgi:hypothetical protein
MSKVVQMIASESSGSGATRYASRAIADSTTSLSVTFMDPVSPTAPQNNATGITSGSAFSWAASGEAATGLHSLLVLFSTNLQFQCVTKGVSCSIPDTHSYGSAWTIPNGGQQGSWQVFTTAPLVATASLSVDDVTDPSPAKNDTMTTTTFSNAGRDSDGASTPVFHLTTF